MQNKNSFIIIKRSLFDHWVWNNGKFSKGQAWVDLIRRANVKYKKFPVNGEFIGIQRGQFITSIEKLSLAWKWSRDSVRRYLNLLESDGMLSRKSNNHYTIITLINYKNLNRVVSQPKQQPAHDQPPAKATTSAQPVDTKQVNQPPQSNNQLLNIDDKTSSSNLVLYKRKNGDDYFFKSFEKICGRKVSESEWQNLSKLFKYQKDEIVRALAQMQKNRGKSLNYLLKVLASLKDQNAAKPNLDRSSIYHHYDCKNTKNGEKTGTVYKMHQSAKYYCEDCGLSWPGEKAFQAHKEAFFKNKK